MDLDSAEHDAELEQHRRRLSDCCVDFTADDGARDDAAAMCSETLMEQYLEHGALSRAQLQRAIARRELFPCFFGSALRLDGVEELLSGLEQYTVRPRYPAAFGAKVYKISRDPQGSRLTWMKITGGGLKVKTLLTNAGTHRFM